MQFLSFAEESSFILELGHWVLDSAALAYAKIVKTNKLKDLLLAFNISSKQFQDKTFLDTLVETAEKHHIEHHHIILELMESTYDENEELIKSNLVNLSIKKFQIAIDDFGTGYSSLSRLVKMPTDILKIDREFTREIGLNESTEMIIILMLSLGKKLKLKVIAEGVETKEQANFLKNHGCDYAQGFLFHPPLNLKDLTKLLKTKK